MNFRRKYAPELPQFQIAPMIDIVFQLLCFFVASQLFAQWETSVDVQLPTAESAQMPDRLPGEIIINVEKSGRTTVNQKRLDDRALTGLLTRIVKLFPGQPVLIRADKATPYEHVIHVLDVCRGADIWNISFATLPSEKP